MNSNVNTKLVSVGDRSFNVIGPQLWNSLSIHIKCSGSLSMFKLTLKTYMFKAEYYNIFFSFRLCYLTATCYLPFIVYICKYCLNTFYSFNLLK